MPPPPRSNLKGLTRFLERFSWPVFLLDDQGKVLYCNEACAHWVGQKSSDLVGKVCCYGSAEGSKEPMSGADLFAPPPQVFQGFRVVVGVEKPTPNVSTEKSFLEEPPFSQRNVPSEDLGNTPEQDRYRAQFIPLPGVEGEVEGVLGLIFPEAPLGTGVNLEEGDFDFDRGEFSPGELHRQLQQFRIHQARRYSLGRFVGFSPAMRRLRSQVKLIGHLPLHAVIVGPQGSGRQHLARTIHYGQANTNARILPITCSLLGVELFQITLRSLGKSIGSLGGMDTLLLHEVSQLPSETQRELALYLSSERSAGMRVLATSQRPLEEYHAKGEFREDLTRLLSVMVLELPPLNQRREDIPPLAQMFLEQQNAISGSKQISGLTPEALDRLVTYDWPGESEELEEVLVQARKSAPGAWIRGEDLPRKLYWSLQKGLFPRAEEETIQLDAFLAEIEQELIRRALEKSGGNKAHAARLLGITRPRLYRRLVQLGMEPGEELPDFEISEDFPTEQGPPE